MKRWLLLIVLLLAGHQFVSSILLTFTDGTPADSSANPAPRTAEPRVPQQTAARRSGVIQRGRFEIQPVQFFVIRARVLGRENYRFDTEAALSPMDLALGWGPMADPSVIQAIRVTQSRRWYHWQTDAAPIPLKEIARNSANMHMIPASEDIREQLRRIRTGDQVLIRGHLVNVERDDGWRWQSSLSRDDRGAGACELVWVEELVITPD